TARHAPPRLLAWILTVVALLVLAGAVVGMLDTQSERSARVDADNTARVAVDALSKRVTALESQSSILAGKLSSAQKQIARGNKGTAPLAAKVLRSVFTVETPNGLGTGWAAWTDNNATYLITANHVAQDAIDSGTHRVTIKQKGDSWNGTIIRTDSTNDLA